MKKDKFPEACDSSVETLDNRCLELFKLLGKELAVGCFIGHVIHELNNKMGPVLLYSELLQSNSGSDTAVKHLKTIEQSTIDARDILYALQVFVRKKRGTKWNTQVEQDIKEVLDTIRFQFDKKEIKILVDIEKGLPSVDMDSLDFSMILFFLLLQGYNNLQDYGGSVKIDVNRENNHILCKIMETSESVSVKLQSEKHDQKLNQRDNKDKIDLLVTYCQSVIKQSRGEILIEEVNENGRSISINLPLLL
ncbi:MAG: hypothetical protein A2161_00500 [Candidatus Schekmanbacteria bacterium RBG_13_48_7]|uniref:Histidine kinase domain-containing protein n=1 Tax=Candidatus Schekmanbacteria bacterium RBG_13_48_7 TaxID=1817878 RepID=A0A1F7RK67_9BACT|nr:MAG: hypothetical protein A2161_00500 [Candidatus Schekmanbacteria bacterium RBG_13_48_7]